MKRLLAAGAAFIVLSAHAEPLAPKPLPVKRIKKLDFDQTRLVVLKDGVEDYNAEDIIRRLKELDKTNGQITFIIESPGGSVDAGEDIIQAMESLKNPLQCIVERRGYSMAAIIAAYCPKLYVYKFASLMFHEASYGLKGSETSIKVRSTIVQKMLDQLKADTAKKLGLTVEEFSKRIHDEWWFTANEAVEMGFATAVLEKLSYEYELPKEEGGFIFFFRTKAFFRSVLLSLVELTK